MSKDDGNRCTLTKRQIEILLAAIEATWQNGAVRSPDFAREVIETQQTLKAMEADGKT